MLCFKCYTAGHPPMVKIEVPIFHRGLVLLFVNLRQEGVCLVLKWACSSTIKYPLLAK